MFTFCYQHLSHDTGDLYMFFQMSNTVIVLDLAIHLNCVRI